MVYSSTAGYIGESGMIYVPLFFIEGLVNFVGYFVLAHLFGKKLRKVTEPLDLAFGYIMWYGLTRVILEPFRDPSFNMGNNGYWSWIWGLMFVLVGSLAIIVNHIVRYIIKKRNNNYIVQKGDVKLGLIETIVFGAIGLGLIIPSIVLMASNSFSEKIGFNPFNIGIILGIVIFIVMILLLRTLSLDDINQFRGFADKLGPLSNFTHKFLDFTEKYADESGDDLSYDEL